MGLKQRIIYQKEYFELFVYQDILKNLFDFLEKFKSISYQAINFSGRKLQNVDENGVKAVSKMGFLTRKGSNSANSCQSSSIRGMKR
jgi:hypothetical protein